MSTGSKTLADRLWALIGVAGVLCIGVAVYLLAQGFFRSTPAEEAHELWAAGREKLEAGDAGGAAADFAAALEKVDGLHPVYRADYGEAQLEAGNSQQAVASWFEAIRLSPVYSRPYHLLAQWFEGEERNGLALSFYRAALALHPEPVPEELPARVAALREELTEAREEGLEEIRGRLRANPADAAALTLLILEELTEGPVAEDAPPSAGIRAALLGVGEELADLDDLLERQRGAVADRPGSVVDQAGLGILLLLRGDFEEAQTVADAALSLSENDPTALFCAACADLFLSAEDTSRIRRATLAMKGSPLSWMAFGAACLAKERREDARKALYRALKLSPAIPEVYRLFAGALTGEGQEEDRRAALRAFRRLQE